MENQTPINQEGQTILSIERAKSMAMGVAIQLTAAFSVAIGIWGLALNKSLLWFSISGMLIGLFISGISRPVILRQKTVEKAKDIMFSIGSIWGGLCTIIGILGLAVWIIRKIF